MLPSATRLATRLLLCVAALPCVAIACDVPEPTSPPPHAVVSRRPPPKPGESISHTMMCSCSVCEPADCCRELEREQPEAPSTCSDGYDFSDCDMVVASCESNCFQHRWRVRVEVGCDRSRPERCCHATSES